MFSVHEVVPLDSVTNCAVEVTVNWFGPLVTVTTRE